MWSRARGTKCGKETVRGVNIFCMLGTHATVDAQADPSVIGSPFRAVMVIHYKMYLATPVPGRPERFPFVFSRADERHTLFVMFGEHGEELLPGVEEGMAGMKARPVTHVRCRLAIAGGSLNVFVSSNLPGTGEAQDCGAP